MGGIPRAERSVVESVAPQGELQAGFSEGANKLQEQYIEKRREDLLDDKKRAYKARLDETYLELDSYQKSLNDEFSKSSLGKNAGKDQSNIYEKYKQFESEKLGELNEEQRNMFEATRGILLRNFDTGIQKHVRNENLKYEKSIYNGVLANGLDNGRRSYLNGIDSLDIILNGDPNDTNNNGVLNAIEERGIKEGISIGEIDKSKRTYMNGFLKETVSESISNKHFKEARLILDYYRKDITSTEYRTLNEMFSNKKLDHDSDLESDRIMGLDKSNSDKLKEIDKIKDKDLKSGTRKKLKQKISESNYENELVVSENSNSIYNFFNNNSRLDDAHKDLLDTLPRAERSALESYINMRKSGNDVETDQLTYQHLSQLSKEQPSVFSKLNLLKFVDKLSSSDFKKFVDKKNNPNKQNFDFTSSDAIYKALDSVITFDREKDSGKKGYAMAFSLIQSDVNSYLSVMKKDSLTKTELDRIIARSVLDIEKKGLFSKKYKLTREPLEDYDAKEKENAINFLNEHYIHVNDDNLSYILDNYNDLGSYLPFKDEE